MVRRQYEDLVAHGRTEAEERDDFLDSLDDILKDEPKQ